MEKGFERGQIVTVYDGDLVGFTCGTLIKRIGIIKEGVLEKWEMITQDGTTLVRFVKDHSQKPLKDGSGYILF